MKKPTPMLGAGAIHSLPLTRRDAAVILRVWRRQGGVQRAMPHPDVMLYLQRGRPLTRNHRNPRIVVPVHLATLIGRANIPVFVKGLPK